MNTRKINFNAGPAALPPEVLQAAAEAVITYKNTGLSILELPHRSTAFLDIIEETKVLVRQLCNLGDDYEVVWVHGGGRMVFAMLPMNYLTMADTAAYIDSGNWAAEAIEYGRHYGKIIIPGSSKATNYDQLPILDTSVTSNCKYVHLTTNNTIYGTQYHEAPQFDVPVVGDMSSDIFSCHRDYTKYSMFYAAAQKNLGTPGVALAVIKKDFLAKSFSNLPPILNFKAYVKENSVLNTANVSGIYTALLMLRWIKAKGIDAIQKDNELKAQLLYNALDSSKIFVPHVVIKEHRSYMNVCFTARDKDIEQAFLTLCAENDVIGVGGHRSVGGFRVSIYNAVTVNSVNRLVDLMARLEAKY